MNIVEYDKNITVHKIFEERAKIFGSKTAIIFGEQSATYQEINNKANRLAKLLCQKGIQENDIVAVYMKRSIHMVISILAILKAGAAYMPMVLYYHFLFCYLECIHLVTNLQLDYA